ncbi:MAG: hypothetical protein AAFQ02_07230 [Bacteroidota bacterium]
MKYIAFFLSLTLLVACSDDDDAGNAGGSSDDQFSATIDGQSYEISGRFAFAEPIDDDLFAVYGSEDQSTPGFTNVFLSFEGRPTVGTYDLSLGSGTLGTWINTGSGETFISGFTGGSGTAEVTEITDDRIKGTFSFVGVDVGGSLPNKVVENGTFDVRIGFE